MSKMTEEAMEQIESASAEQETRIQRAISAALGGLMPAVASTVGDAPTDASKFDKWEARAQRAAAAMVSAAIGAVRAEVRQDEAIMRLKRKFLGTTPNHKIVRGIVLGVMTRGGSGVLFTQSVFTPESDRLPPEVALERAKKAVMEKNSDVFRGDFGGRAAGELGAKGIERFWLGRRSDEEASRVYAAAIANAGKLCHIYKVIEETEDGKKLKKAKFLEPVAGFEHSTEDNVDDLLEQVEDYANTAGDESEPFEFESADSTPAAQDFPQDPKAFGEWAKSHGFAKSDFDAAKERVGITEPLRDMWPDQIAKVCEAMLSKETADTSAW